MGQTLRDWYRYLEQQMHVSLREDQQHAAPAGSARAAAASFSSAAHDEGPPGNGSKASGPGALGTGPPPPAAEEPRPQEAAAGLRAAPRDAGLGGGALDAVEERPLPVGLGELGRRRGGRRPMTETREEIIRRLLDPELTLHEAAAILNLSKATVRRYTDQGRLMCFRTRGGQRRFRLSALLAFLDRQAAGQGHVEAGDA
jgi:excisionase family DNA binding protein